MDCLDFGHLPFEIRSKLAELEVELSEGDITEKGYQKKKAKLLAPYIESTVNPSPPLTSTPNVTQSSSGLHIPCGAVQLPGLTGSALDRRRLQLRSPASSGEDGSISGPDDNSNDCENGSPLHRPQNRRYIREDGRYRSGMQIPLLFLLFISVDSEQSHLTLIKFSPKGLLRDLLGRAVENLRLWNSSLGGVLFRGSSHNKS
ncbi:DMAP1-binding domain protein [Opisthorchis viverrini]|uniref:DMAP1-binding domain protein n=1 Tax=Opisthorchis viverrini TaxID=6198 RepID=A0A1S8X2Y3_OPIVI|nr:DMAP1-binding domain protein [Opisthorchis viverrini]